jgi:DNA-binding PadR family transcriptional regulator
VKRIDFKERGLIALAILRELEKGPVHGYALMTRFEEMYGFKPSPGAIYPVLKRLTDMGFIDVEVRSEDGRRVKVYSITEEGRLFLSERREALARLEEFANNMKLAKTYGFTRLVRDIMWLFRNIGKVPRDKLEEISVDARTLSDKIEKLRSVE